MVYEDGSTVVEEMWIRQVAVVWLDERESESGKKALEGRAGVGPDIRERSPVGETAIRMRSGEG